MVQSIQFVPNEGELLKKTFQRMGRAIWSVKRSELKKVILFFSLLFFICMAYSILRNVKDALVLTGQGAGAEVIPFLKVWGILPAVFAATWGYTRLSRLFSKEAVFYLVIGVLVAFFLFFVFWMYPHMGQLALDRASFSSFPQGLSGLVSMVCNWPLSLFYIMAELWSVLLLSVVFWGFTNDEFGLKEATRTYGILNLGSNVSPIAAGAVAIFLTRNGSDVMLPFAVDLFQANLMKLLGAVTCCAIASVALFWYINRKLLLHPFHWTNRHQQTEGTSKPRLSMRACFRTVMRSPYLLLLTLIVLGYNVAINFTDILWKQQLKTYFSDPSALLNHMSFVSFGTGVVAILGAVFFSVLMTRIGWTGTAILTPVLMTILAVGFFLFYFFSDQLSSLSMMLFGLSPLAMTAYFGSWQNLISKAGKYSLFDATKELAFLPLSYQERYQGKAAIDGLGSGVGKSGASMLYQGLLIVFGTVSATSPIIAVLVMTVLVVWTGGVYFLGKRFKMLVPDEGAHTPSGIPIPTPSPSV